jgi:RNA polymerase sigma-70 factor (ECF subfamily)
LPPEDSFADVMARLRAADPDAADAVFHRFADRLTALARKRLGKLRRKVDAEDVLQSVYLSFFRRHGNGRFVLEGWDDLWALLTTITVRKCGRWRDYFHAGVRNIAAETRADGVLELLDREPTPLEVAALADEVTALLRGLSERDVNIVSLRLQGYTPSETAERLDIPERTVNRILDHTRRRLKRLRDKEAPGR